MRRLVWVFAALLLGLSAVPFAPGVSADAIEGLLSAEAESYAVRVQYDIPLPIGPGTVPHVVGEVRRSQAGENAKGVAAAPTHFDAVVGGTYYDPDKDNDDSGLNCGPGNRTGCNLPPQTECFYPGTLLDTKFAFPTDTKPDGSTKPLPATSYSTARCGAGPEAELHAVGAGVGPTGTATEALGPAVSVGAAAADALIRPVKGTLESTTSSRASGISIGGGAVTIGAVDASGRSQITGAPGGEKTEARIAVVDVVAGDSRFSIEGGQLVMGDQAVPIDSSGAKAAVEGINGGLAGLGCRIDLVTNPARYPQGFLFSRPDPKLGLDPAGKYAGSMAGGLVVLCDLPEAVTGATEFNPQRVQVVVGFAYTRAASEEETGGFGIGDLAGVFSDAPLPPAAPVVAGTSFTAPLATAPTVDTALTPAPAPATPPADLEVAGPRVETETAQPVLADFDMDPSTRWVVGVVSLVVWAALTHAGAQRLRGLLS